MIAFLVDVVTARTALAKLRAENGRLKADVRWLSDERDAANGTAAELLKEVSRLRREVLRAIGHPAMRQQLKRVSLWN